MNYIVKDFKDGSKMLLSEMGIVGEIRQVWTILDMEGLFTQFDMQTGAPRKVELQEVKPVHWKTAFMEDKMHDWDVRDGYFKLHAHSDKAGALHDLLIVTK